MEERPACPGCGNPMLLLVIEESRKDEPSHYECVCCDYRQEQIKASPEQVSKTAAA